MSCRRLVIELLTLHKDMAYGFQQYILNILDYFHAHREDILYDQIILCCKDTEEPLLSKYADKFQIMGLHVRNYAERLWYQTSLPIKLRLSGQDLLMSPANTSGLIKRCPELLVIHDLLFKRKELCNPHVRYHRNFYVPRSIRKADRIVAISDSTRHDIEQYYPQSKGKIDVIYNPIHFSKFDGDSETMDVGSDYFLAISSSSNFKNQITILRSFQQYRETGGEKRLVMVGLKSPISESCIFFETMPQDIKDGIIWKSGLSNPELGCLYRQASCYISASKFEGLGMPVIEAMSFGLPVVLSDIPVHREASQGRGSYFPSTDVDKLASIMKEMDFRKRDYAELIRSTYSDHNTSARYVELINRMWNGYSLT